MDAHLVYDFIISLLGGGSIAWVIVKLYVKDIAAGVVKEVLKTKQAEFDEKYTTSTQMQIERKELLEEVERRFLEKVAFREFEKRMDDKFADTSKTLDKIVENQEHIKDFLMSSKFKEEKE